MQEKILRNNIWQVVLWVVGLLMLHVLGGCKKFLEAEVDDRLGLMTLGELEQKTMKDMPGADYLFTDLMTDDYVYKDIPFVVNTNYFLKSKPIFNFTILKKSLPKAELLFEEGGYNPTSSFLNYYNKINSVALTLHQLESISIHSELDEKRKQLIKAQALAINGYCYFMLANIFAPQYQEATANQVLTVPFLEGYSKVPVVFGSRATLQFIYDKVEANWLQALALMEDGSGFFNSKFYFNKPGIQGLLSRLYLNKKDWNRCVHFANMALANQGGEPLQPFNIKKLILEKGGAISSEFSLAYYDPANPSYLVIGDDVLNLASWPRLSFYTDSAHSFASRFKIASAEYSVSNATVGDEFPIKLGYFFQVAQKEMSMPLITVDEIYFNRAEACIAKQQFDSARQDLLRLLDCQNVTSDSLVVKKEYLEGNSPQKFMVLLLDLKRLRFTAEGMRWFDIKRHRIPVRHTMGNQLFELEGKAEDYIIQLPLEEIWANSKL